MNKANELKQKYEADLKELQDTCEHEHKSDDVLASDYYMHFSRMARFCLECNKEFPPLKSQDPIIEYLHDKNPGG